MKTIITLSLLSLLLFSCKKETVVKEKTPEVEVSETAIPFKGAWSRDFEAGTAGLHTVRYLISQDEIEYKLTGSIGQADYKIIRDTFLLENNRFIGHRPDNIYYLIFVKDVSEDSISIYKQLISNFNEGMNVAVPSDTSTQNHGWSTYFKN